MSLTNSEIDSTGVINDRYLAYENMLLGNLNAQLIAQNEDFINTLNEVKEEYIKAINKELDAADADRFLNTHLVSILKTLLGQRYEASSIGYYKATAFVIFAIHHQVNSLREMNPANSKILETVFDPRKPYYSPLDNGDIEVAGEFELTVSELDIEVKSSSNFVDISLADKMINFALHANFFGQLGGFEIFCEVIKNAEPTAKNLTILKQILTTAKNIIPCLNKEQWENCIMPIGEAGAKFMPQLKGAELEKVKDSHVRKLFDALKGIFRGPPEVGIESTEAIDTAETILAIKLFKVPSIEKKQAGLNVILSKICQLRRKWPVDYFDSGTEAYNLAKILADEKFFKHLIQNLSLGLLKQSESILELLYAWRHITSEDIIALWGMARTSAGSLRVSLLHMVGILALHLSYSDFGRLLEYLRSVPLCEHTLEVADIVLALGKNEYLRNKKKSGLKIERLRGGVTKGAGTARAGKGDTSVASNVDMINERNMGNASPRRRNIPSEEQPFTLEDFPADPNEPKESFDAVHLTFEFIQDEAIKKGLKEEVQAKLVELFISMVIKYFGSKCKYFLSSCEKLLFLDFSTLQMMKVYTKLVEHLLKDKYYKLKPLAEEFFQRFIISLVKFKRNAAASMNSLEECDKLITNELHSVDYYTELGQRLEFIRFLIVRGKLIPTSRDIDVLIQVFVFASLSKRELSAFFDFMQGLLRSEAGIQLVTEGCLDRFLSDVLMRVSFNEYTEVVFACLKDMLIAVNAHYKLLKTNARGSFDVLGVELVGLPFVWEVAVYAGDEEVFKSASAFLREIYKGDAVSNGKGVKELFVANCINYIKIDPKEFGKDPKAIGRVIRGLELLGQYIESDLVTSGKDHSSAQGKSEFIISAHWGQVTKVDISVIRNTQVKEMLEQIRKAIGRSESIDELQFFAKGKQVTPSNETLWKYGIKEPVSIEVSLPSNNHLEEEKLGANQQSQQAQGQQAQVLQEDIEFLRSVYPDLAVPLLEAALKKYNNDVSQVAIMLTEENTLKALQSEAEAENTKEASVEKRLSVGEVITGSEEFSKVLYSLLGCDVDEVLAKIWGILEHVPAEAALAEYETSDLVWDVLVPMEAPYKLLYSTRCITNMLEQQKEWAEKFVVSEGFKYLCTILLAESKTEEVSEIKMRIIETIVKIITSFLSTALNEHAKSRYSTFKEKFDSDKQEKYLYLSSKSLAEVLDTAKEFELHNIILSILLITAKEDEDVKKVVVSFRKELMHSLFLILYSNLECAGSFCTHPSFSKYIVETFSNPGNKQAKEELQRSLIYWFEVAQNNSSPASAMQPGVFVLNVLLSVLFDGKKLPIKSDALFNFLGELLYYYHGKSADKISHTLEELTLNLLKSVQTISEIKDAKGNIAADYDEEFVGEIYVLSKIIETSPAIVKKMIERLKMDLMRVIFVEMYGDPSNIRRRRRLTSPIGLASSIKIVVKLAKMDESYNALALSSIAAFHDSLKDIKKFVSSEMGVRQANSYVGLQNFGCTCYINSLLQQFFMMPELRNRLLKLDPKKLQIKDADHVLLNLQKIFFNLLYSKSEYYAPSSFCNEFRDYDLQVIDVRVQQDVDEFFNQLMDKAETELKTVGEKNMFRKILQLEVTQEITSLENKFPYVSTLDEQHVSLPLDIKGKKSLEDALDQFVKEEILDHDNIYYCEKYDRKVKASKKYTLKSLSKIVIISMKRFEFNYKTNQKRKLNDYCSFPLEIDFSRWMRKAPRTLYELVGVLIHSGVAEGGHYYSFIKERDKNSPNYGRWFNFNDTHVNLFDIAELEKAAFGFKGSEYGEWGTSAYLLVYQQSGTAAPSKTIVEKLSEEMIKEQKEAEDAGVFLDKNYQRSINEYIRLWQSNHCLPLIKEKARLLCRLVVVTACKAWDAGKDSSNADFEMWFDVIAKCLKESKEGNEWILSYLSENEGAVFGMLLESDLRNARVSFSKVIVALLLAQEGTESQKDAEEFVRLLMQKGLAHASSNCSKFTQYFQLLLELITHSELYTKFLVSTGFIGKLISFIANTFSGSSSKDSQAANLSFRPPIGLLCQLICSCCTQEMLAKKSTPKHSLIPLSKMLPLPIGEANLLFSFKWSYLSLLEDCNCEVQKMLAHLCWETPRFSAPVTRDITKAIIAKKAKCNYDKEMAMLKDLLLSTDSVNKERVNIFLGVKVNDKEDLYDILKHDKVLHSEFVIDMLCLIADLRMNAETGELVDVKKLDWAAKWIEEKEKRFEILMNGEMGKNKEAIEKCKKIKKVFGASDLAEEKKDNIVLNEKRITEEAQEKGGEPKSEEGSKDKETASKINGINNGSIKDK